MSDFDDMFKDNKKDEIFFAQKPEAQDPNEEIYHLHNEQRINRIIILVYFGVMLLVSLFTQMYTTAKYPDSGYIVDQITIVTEPEVTVDDSSDSNYTYEIYFSGVLRNDSSITLPRMWIQFDLYDADGLLVSSQYIDSMKVNSGGVFTISDSYFSDYNVTDFQYSYGFDESSIFYIVINLLQVTIIAFILLYVDKTNFKKDWTRTKAAPLKSLGLIVGGFVMVYVVMILAQLLMENLFNVAASSENEMMISSMFSDNPLNLVLLFLLLCVFTPIVEELVFRKVIYSFFERKFGYIVAIISSGLIFGLMHVLAYFDFIQAIPYVMMGSVFGYVYYNSKKNIFITIGVHFINNLISFLFYFAVVIGLL